MKVGNRREVDFELACIICGAKDDLSLTAFRNTLNFVTGWIVSCKGCQPVLSELVNIKIGKE